MASLTLGSLNLSVISALHRRMSKTGRTASEEIEALLRVKLAAELAEPADPSDAEPGRTLLALGRQAALTDEEWAELEAAGRETRSSPPRPVSIDEAEHEANSGKPQAAE